MSEIIDLDTFVPQPCIIKFGEEEITVNPPRTIDYLQLGVLTDKLNHLEGLSDEAVQTIIDRIIDRIYICVPQLKGKTLNKLQLQMLVNIISRMAQPEEQKTQDGKTITKDASPKEQ